MGVWKIGSPDSYREVKNPKTGEMAEWSNAAVLKTVEGHTSGGSNPSFSAKENPQQSCGFFYTQKCQELVLVNGWG